MEKASECTVVIQGPMKNGLPSVYGFAHYEKQFNEVIVSCYENETVNSLFDKCKIVRSKPEIPTKNNRGNIYRQCMTTLAGLRLVSTPYVVKVRSDECYYNLNLIVDKLQQNPDKIVCIGRESNRLIDDHVIAAKTEYYIKMCEWIMNGLEHNLFRYQKPEWLFAQAFISIFHSDVLNLKHKEHMNFCKEKCIYMPHKMFIPYIASAHGKYRINMDLV